MITLSLMYGVPFTEFPQLWDIWPEPYAAEAAEACEEDAGDWNLFFIRQDGEVVGITGVFEQDDGVVADIDTLLLRWTGVIPSKRKQGITRQALDLLIGEARLLRPKAHKLIELAPDNEYGREQVMPAFEKLGFVKHGPVIPYYGVPHQPLLRRY